MPICFSRVMALFMFGIWLFFCAILLPEVGRQADKEKRESERAQNSPSTVAPGNQIVAPTTHRSPKVRAQP
jgi:hypothetical protein